MKSSFRISLLSLAFTLVLGLSANSHAQLLGTVPVTPGTTVVPGLVPVGTSAGTLLASLVAPWTFTTTAGTTAGTLTSAVFRESGGTLDFYYQVINNTGSATSIARESDVTFTGFTTAVGYRTDGASLSGSLFVNGSVLPATADRNTSGSTIGFNFGANEVLPGQQSRVLVISTNATAFTAGNASVIDGGSATVASFQPVPEPASMLVLGLGLLGLRRRKQSR